MSTEPVLVDCFDFTQGNYKGMTLGIWYGYGGLLLKRVKTSAPTSEKQKCSEWDFICRWAEPYWGEALFDYNEVRQPPMTADEINAFMTLVVALKVEED